MSEDPFMELVLRESTPRLRQIEAGLNETMRRLAFERDIVREALTIKEGAERGHTRQLDIRTDTGPEPLRAPTARERLALRAKDSRESRRRAPRTNKREPIKQIMASDPGRVWMPIEIAAALAAEGIEASKDTIRVTMRRMVDEHELARPSDGNGFVLASNGLHTTSANGRDPEAEDRETGLR